MRPREAWGRQPHTDAQSRMRLGASEFVTSPQSDLTTHDAPELSVVPILRGQRIGRRFKEGAMGKVGYL